MNKISCKLILLLLIYFSSFNITSGQETILENENLRKNSIYGNVGHIGVAASAAGYYERILTQRMNNDKKVYSFVKVGYGILATFGGESTFISAQYGLLIGGGKNFLEIGAGPSYYFSGNLNDAPLNALVGWRVQKPGGKFNFRMGVSWPEIFYIGVGVSF